MEVGHFQFHRRAFAALNELSPADRAKVLDQLAALNGIPRRDWSARQQVRKLGTDPALYLLRIDQSLRVIVRAPEGHEPEVLDLVRHETLERFAKAGK
jgi:hypothetical protein